MIEAARDHDYAMAREYALILKNWLESGGFYPIGHHATTVMDAMARVLRPGCTANALRFPMERLACRICDAGDALLSLGDAIESGWTGIDFAPDYPHASHIGLCPECRKGQDEEIGI